MTNEIHDFASPIFHNNNTTWTGPISVLDGTDNITSTGHLTTEGAVHQSTASNTVREYEQRPFVGGILGNGRGREERGIGYCWEGCSVYGCCSNWVYEE